MLTIFILVKTVIKQRLHAILFIVVVNKEKTTNPRVKRHGGTLRCKGTLLSGFLTLLLGFLLRRRCSSEV